VDPVFIDDPKGELAIWYEPDPSLRYAMGVDSSEGIRGGDYAVAYVIESQTMKMCARWRGLIDANQWALCCCLLGYAYNEAFICFETGGSAHGLTAANNAMLLGYPNLYRRIHQDQVQRQETKKLGYRTDVRTRPMLFNRVRVALEEEYEINCPILLHEARGIKLNEKGQIVHEDHDDTVIAYALTLEARDAGYTSGIFEAPTSVERLTDEDRMWDEWEAEDKAAEELVFGVNRRLRRHNGSGEEGEEGEEGVQRGRGFRRK